METNPALVFLEQIVSEQLLSNLIQQINKDARLSGIEAKFETTLSPKQLAIQLSELLYQLISSDFGSYLNFLYRIDIPEKTLRSIQETAPKLIVKQVTVLVLKREWQKVTFKNKSQ